LAIEALPEPQLQKRAIVAASLAPGAIVTEVARRAEVCPGRIYRWRREIALGNGFAQAKSINSQCHPGEGCLTLKIDDQHRV
jgi:hypothetical protein